jgi:hypothetical protein
MDMSLAELSEKSLAVSTNAKLPLTVDQPNPPTNKTQSQKYRLAFNRVFFTLSGVILADSLAVLAFGVIGLAAFWLV